MDKISGIIPSSPRLSSVDMKEASAIRPGTPSFGRPEGVSSLSKQEVPLQAADTTARKGIMAQENLMDWRSKDARQAAIAAEMTDKFFMKNNRAAEPATEVGQHMDVRQLSALPVASTPTGFKNDQVAAKFAARFDEDEEPITLQQPEGLFPKGSFIDRTA